MKIKRICIGAAVLTALSAGCSREGLTEGTTTAAYEAAENIVVESEDEIGETAAATQGDIPEFLKAVSEEVYLEEDTELWEAMEKEAAHGLYKGFELCELVIDGVRHKAVYNEDGIVIIENLGENGAAETYTVVYNGKEVTVPMGYPLGSDIRVSVTLRDIEGDGVKELFLGCSGMEGEPSYINVIRLEPVKAVPVEYSSKTVQDSLAGYGIEGVEYGENGEAEVTFFVENAAGNREYGQVLLKNDDIPGEYEMVLNDVSSANFNTLMGNDKSSTEIMGISTFQIMTVMGDGSGYSVKDGSYAYVLFYRFLEYDEEGDRYVPGKTGVLSWTDPKGNKRTVEIDMAPTQ